MTLAHLLLLLLLPLLHPSQYPLPLPWLLLMVLVLMLAADAIHGCQGCICSIHTPAVSPGHLQHCQALQCCLTHPSLQLNIEQHAAGHCAECAHVWAALP